MRATTYLSLFAWSLTACNPSNDTGQNTDTDIDTDSGQNTDTDTDDGDGVAAARIAPEALTEVSEASCVALDEAGNELVNVDRAVSWQADGTEVATTSTLTGEHFSKGQRVTCTLTPPQAPSAAVTSPEVLVDNALPSVSGATIAPAPLTTGGEATCEGSGWADADDDPAGYDVAWRVDGAEVSTEPTLAAEHVTRGQTVSCTLTPWDGEATGTPVSSAEVEVSNAPPSITSARLEPDAPTTTSVIRVADVVTEDPESDTVTVAYAWTVDGTPAGTNAELAGELFTRGQQVRVTLTPNDGVDDGLPLELGPVTVANTPPTLSLAQVSPGQLTGQSEARCEGSGWVDPDGDTEDYAVRWLVDDVEVSTAEVLTSDHISKGQAVRCELTPHDGTHSGSPVSSAAVVVQNTAPTLSGGAIEPAQAGATVDRSVVGLSPDDLDGDAVSLAFRWFLDGEEASTEPTLLSAFLLRGLSITVEVTPNDGEASGEPVVLGPVVVANTAPEVISAEIVGAPARTNSVLELNIESYDTDDDPLTTSITWLVDGSEVATSPTLDGATHFSKGQEVSASVTVQDDASTSDAFTTEAVVIENTPPGAPEVVIAGTSPGAPLVCTITAPAADADSDPLDYRFDWVVDGAPFTGTTTTTHPGDTVPGEAVVEDQEWTCTASASDGDDEGPSASHSFTSGYGPWTLGNCSAEGQYGPSQADCDAAYAYTLMADITVLEGIQFFRVPISGTYRIEASGAQGASADRYAHGGRGARMRGDFNLSQGDELAILVGQTGTEHSCSGGGGGGTFVVRNATPLVVAGGGGGVRTSTSQNGCDGRTGEYGGTGSGSDSYHYCSPKLTSRRGGGAVTEAGYGSGGGGYAYDGAGEFAVLNGGRAYLNGGAGGGYSSYIDHGGFGGGGAGNGSCGGGGGGGYSGGDGGRIAGGGGSYNSGGNQSNSAGAREGHGQVTIELL